MTNELTGLSLPNHLIKFGVHHFSDGSYWSWGGEQLGEKRARHLDKLRKPLVRGKPKKADLFAFYEYIAKPEVSSVVHSMKADAIRASGEFVTSHIQGKRILDIGCNIGYLTSWYALANPEAEIFGIDFSPTAIDLAKRYALQLGINNLQFIALDGNQFKPAHLYDCIIDTQGMISPELDSKGFKLLLSWLQSGGTLIVVPPFGSLPMLERFLDIVYSCNSIVMSFDWLQFSDLGTRGMYPGMTLAHAASGVGLSREKVLGMFRDGLLSFSQESNLGL